MRTSSEKLLPGKNRYRIPDEAHNVTVSQGYSIAAIQGGWATVEPTPQSRNPGYLLFEIELTTEEEAHKMGRDAMARSNRGGSDGQA